jgi:anti-anti-sigma factor
MPTSLSLRTVRSDQGTTVLKVVGEIDLSNVESFAQALETAMSEATDTTLTVDLSAVEYLDSAAVNVLFPRAERIRLIAHPFLYRIFGVSGLSELTDVELAPESDEN